MDGAGSVLRWLCSIRCIEYRLSMSKSKPSGALRMSPKDKNVERLAPRPQVAEWLAQDFLKIRCTTLQKQRRMVSGPLPSAIILFPTVSGRFSRVRKPQVLRAFEGKAVDYRSGNSPRSLSLWPILSKAVDCGNLIRVFNALFLNDISAQQFRKVRKSATRATEFGIEPEP